MTVNVTKGSLKITGVTTLNVIRVTYNVTKETSNFTRVALTITSVNFNVTKVPRMLPKGAE